ncbi:MAG: hypothetical protein IPG76_22360 [Acidobacteria bacterium]|nr:hypothetical protein [Acidobacteriota bacterium]
MTRGSLDGLAQERANLLAEVDEFSGWLQRRLADDKQVDVPSPRTDLIPSASRLAELDAGLKDALQTLPPTVRIMAKFSALPNRRIKVKELHPAETAYEAFERSGRDEIRAILQAVEAEHLWIARKIEQAREVVAFGMGTDGESQRRDPQIVHVNYKCDLAARISSQRDVDRVERTRRSPHTGNGFSICREPPDPEPQPARRTRLPRSAKLATGFVNRKP